MYSEYAKLKIPSGVILKFRIRTSFISREGAAIVNLTRFLTAFYRNNAHSYGGPSSVLVFLVLFHVLFLSAIPRIVFFVCYSTYCVWVLFYVLFFNLPNFFRLGKFFNIKKSTQQRFEEQFSELLKNCFYYKWCATKIVN